MNLSRNLVLAGFLFACGGDTDEPTTDTYTTTNSEGPCTPGEPDAIRHDISLSVASAPAGSEHLVGAAVDFIASDSMEVEYEQDGVVYRVTYLVENVDWEPL